MSSQSEPSTPARETGNVSWFDPGKGYGFIKGDSGGDIFVRYTDIRGEGYRVLFEGARVEYKVVQGEKGLEARDVVVLDTYPQN